MKDYQYSRVYASLTRWLFVCVDAPVHQVLRSEDDLAQNRLVLDDPDIAFDVERLRQPVVE